MTRAICMNYNTIKLENPAISESEAAQNALRRRYRILKLHFSQQPIFDVLVCNVQNLRDACCVAVTVEQEATRGYPLEPGEAEEVVDHVMRKMGLG